MIEKVGMERRRREERRALSLYSLSLFRGRVRPPPPPRPPTLSTPQRPKIVTPAYLNVAPADRLPWRCRAHRLPRLKKKKGGSASARSRRHSFAGACIVPPGAPELTTGGGGGGKSGSGRLRSARVIMASLLDRVLHKHKAKTTAELVARTGAALEKCRIDGSAGSGGVPRTASGSGDGWLAAQGGGMPPSPASEKWMDEVGRLLGAMKVRKREGKKGVPAFFFDLGGGPPAAGWCFRAADSFSLLSFRPPPPHAHAHTHIHTPHL